MARITAQNTAPKNGSRIQKNATVTSASRSRNALCWICVSKELPEPGIRRVPRRPRLAAMRPG